MSNDGATVVPASPVDAADRCLGRYKHSWTWQGFDKQVCMNCGEGRTVDLKIGLSPAANRPSDDEIVTALAMHFKCPEAVTLSWLTSMHAHFDPKKLAENLAARAV